jgi:hypothetical protein
MVPTWTKSAARIVVARAASNARQVCPGRRAAGSIPASLEDLPHRRCRERVAQAGRLAAATAWAYTSRINELALVWGAGRSNGIGPPKLIEHHADTVITNARDRQILHFVRLRGMR